MKTCWTQGINKELAIDITQNYKESLVMRRQLVNILNSKIEQNRKEESSKSLFDNPNWALLQSNKMGYERALRDIIELILEN